MAVKFRVAQNKISRLHSVFSLFREMGFKEFFKSVESATKRKYKASFLQIENSGLVVNAIERDAISRMLSTGERYESHIFDICEALLVPTDNVIDVGANIGVHTITLAGLVKQGTVTAFEPSGIIFNLLQKNILDNGVKNAFAYKYAIEDKFGVSTISTEDFSKSEMNTGNQRITDNFSGENVMSFALDYFEFESVKLVKMDIQGCELRAINGMQSFIRKNRPFIIFEVEEHQLRQQKTSSEELIQRMFDLGFVVFRINTSYSADHLAVPVEKLKETLLQIEKRTLNFTLTEMRGSRVKLYFEGNSNLYSHFRID
jgi:FkbM family methyltransferase